MNTVTMLDLRKDAAGVISKVRQGQPSLLLYRGKPVLRLEPLRNSAIAEDDPFYQLASHAEAKGKSLSNADMDRAIYGL